MSTLLTTPPETPGRRLRLWLPLLLVLQLALVGLAVLPQLSARVAGDEIVLRVQPVDPIDPFRGAYVTLGYPDLRHNDAESAANMDSMRKIWTQMEPLTHGFYVNSRSEDDLKAFRENYGDNYPRLVKLKNRYDPTNLFRLNANVVPTA